MRLVRGFLAFAVVLASAAPVLAGCDPTTTTTTTSTTTTLPACGNAASPECNGSCPSGNRCYDGGDYCFCYPDTCLGTNCGCAPMPGITCGTCAPGYTCVFCPELQIGLCIGGPCTTVDDCQPDEICVDPTLPPCRA